MRYLLVVALSAALVQNAIRADIFTDKVLDLLLALSPGFVIKQGVRFSDGCKALYKCHSSAVLAFQHAMRRKSVRGW